MHASHRLTGFALASLSGCLWFLACTPFDVPGLAWIAAVPLLLALDRSPTLGGALFLGWWAGVVETGGGFYWVIDVTQRFAGFGWFAAAGVFFAFCATRAVIFLIFGGIVHALRRRRATPLVVLAPLALVVGEFIVPQLFPCGQWITQAWHPLVIQIAELTGPLGVSALLMVVNGALTDLLTRARFALASGIAAGVVLAAALAYGAIRMHQVDALVARAPRLEVGLVQPNFAYTVDGGFSREETLRELDALQEQSRRLEHAGAQVVIWSEGSYPIALPRSFSADFPDSSLAKIRRGIAGPVLIGANTVDDDQENAFNSALLLDRAGQVTGRYDKVELLAFGEYIPGIDLFPWIADLLPPGTGKFKAGAAPVVLTLDASPGAPWRLGPLICYEDLLPDYIRRVGRTRPDLLVNLTSDQWFGAGSEPWEHLALSVFASVELRVALVRAVNSGVSAMIDPNGRRVTMTYADDPYRDPRPSDGVLVAAPKMAGGRTLFVAWGDWFAVACGTALVGLTAFGGRNRPRSAGHAVRGGSPS
jgi:apolipoprotein N-acyltransferase